MNSNLRLLGALAAGALCASPLAQPQPEAPDAAPTLAERVLALERGVASLTTRFDLREAARQPDGDVGLGGRVTRLEGALDRLTSDLQRVEQQADAAWREASQARRDALDAQRVAQSAAMRMR